MQITDPKSAFKGWHEVHLRYAPGEVEFNNRRIRVHGIRPEIKAWLQEHVGEYGRGGWISNAGRHGRVYTIRNAGMALLFKLTWAGKHDAA